MFNIFRFGQKVRERKQARARLAEAEERARLAERTLPPEEYERNDIVFRNSADMVEQESFFDSVVRAVARYRHPNAMIASGERSIPNARTIVQVLSETALDDEFEGTAGLGQTASNLLFDFLERATKERVTRLPNADLARKWLEARKKLDEIEVRIGTEDARTTYGFDMLLQAHRDTERELLELLAENSATREEVKIAS